ncbi:hypothetical protein CRENBAI_004627 [Crenichthys baileyi]|uniref:Ig-like domain-containing protein n=1 Tax=Crenichthys baileyi TaxID=28760 RepID=A0AAV9S8L2_9TELE
MSWNVFPARSSVGAGLKAREKGHLLASGTLAMIFPRGAKKGRPKPGKKGGSPTSGGPWAWTDSASASASSVRRKGVEISVAVSRGGNRPIPAQNPRNFPNASSREHWVRYGEFPLLAGRKWLNPLLLFQGKTPAGKGGDCGVQGPKAADKPRASLTAERTILTAGGSVALSCSVFFSAGWKIDWFRQESESSRAQLIRSNEPDGVLRVSEGGVYSCRGGRGDPVFYTETSNKVSIQKIEKLVPVLSVSPSWLSPGASVTLSCEVEPQSAGWRFFWYKAVPELSVRSYSFELLPNITSRTEQNSSIVHGQTHTAGYVCRAGRGEPLDYTGYSEPKFGLKILIQQLLSQ